MNNGINKFLNCLFIQLVPKRELTFALGYLGKSSLDLRTRVRQTDLKQNNIIVSAGAL